MKSYVSFSNTTAEFFRSQTGVRQGENLSPFLFALYVNDLESYLIEQNCEPVVLSAEQQDIWLKLLVVLYADDTALIAETKEELQKGLSVLKQYCDKWKLALKSSKTKIIIFSISRVDKGKFNFKIGEDIIEIVDSFKYLGVTFQYNGRFTLTRKSLRDQANRAMFSVYKRCRVLQLPVDLQFDLFDKMVLPIMLYGCEVWGYENVNIMETLHLKFCKMVLKLKKSTPNVSSAT